MAFDQTARDAISALTGGAMAGGRWVKLPAIYKLLIDGTGTITIDQRDRAGAITSDVAAYSPTGPAEIYPFFTGAYEVRATLTGTASAEIV
jgi:hypothetical protein